MAQGDSLGDGDGHASSVDPGDALTHGVGVDVGVGSGCAVTRATPNPSNSAIAAKSVKERAIRCIEISVRSVDVDTDALTPQWNR